MLFQNSVLKKFLKQQDQNEVVKAMGMKPNWQNEPLRQSNYETD